MAKHNLCLLIGNSRWHWGIYQNKEWNLNSKVINQKNIHNNDLSSILWAAVGEIPLSTNLNDKKRILTENIPIINFPKWIGVDRALAAYAAISRFTINSRSDNLLIVDAGTVMSLTLINKNGTFLGGQLIPGMKTQISAMINNTKNLNGSNLIKVPKELFPKDTISAMHKGVAQAIIGAINLASENNKNQIVLTGGDGKTIYQEISKYNQNSIYIPHLALNGLVELLEKKHPIAN
tara:strand:+ start:9832 stop:10536 length:705 start_codon:yes stop_codon:yes gene_type:complete